MTRRPRSRPAFLATIAALLPACITPGCTARVPEGVAQAEIPAAREANQQDEAIRLAREVDIPAAKQADHVVIRAVGARIEGDRQVTINDADKIGAISRELRPMPSPPSGGMIAATLTFYRGERIVRRIWVYEGGEWGFDRPGTRWTTGLSPELWQTVQAQLR